MNSTIKKQTRNRSNKEDIQTKYTRYNVNLKLPSGLFLKGNGKEVTCGQVW